MGPGRLNGFELHHWFGFGIGRYDPGYWGAGSWRRILYEILEYPILGAVWKAATLRESLGVYAWVDRFCRGHPGSHRGVRQNNFILLPVIWKYLCRDCSTVCDWESSANLCPVPFPSSGIVRGADSGAGVWYAHDGLYGPG